MNQLDLNPAGDHIVRAMALDGKVRMTAIRSTEMVAEAIRLHGLSPMAAVALGRFMSGLQLLSMDLKNSSDSITGIIRCDGPLGGMTSVVEQDSRVRGFVLAKHLDTQLRSPQKFDVAAVVGNGVLTVIREQGGAKPYAGSVELVSGEIAEDLTYYLAISEQIPTILGLGVLLNGDGVKAAGGYLIQVMPEAGPEVLDYLEQRAGGFPDVTFLLEEGFTPAQILDLFAGDENIEYMEVRPSSYACTCSRERMAKALMTLGEADLAELREDGDGANLHCEFCNTNYHFDVEELVQLHLAKTTN